MLYIGLRILEAHPLFGAGWQSVREQHVYSPFLAAAHRRFPNQPGEAFPSPTNRWGIDNAYVESLAELGDRRHGACSSCFLGDGARARRPRARCARRPARPQLALVGLLWLLVTIGIWAGQGFVAGTGFAALPFFGLGPGRRRPRARVPEAPPA